MHSTVSDGESVEVVVSAPHLHMTGDPTGREDGMVEEKDTVTVDFPVVGPYAGKISARTGAEEAVKGAVQVAANVSAKTPLLETLK